MNEKKLINHLFELIIVARKNGIHQLEIYKEKNRWLRDPIYKYCLNTITTEGKIHPNVRIGRKRIHSLIIETFFIIEEDKIKNWSIPIHDICTRLVTFCKRPDFIYKIIKIETILNKEI